MPRRKHRSRVTKEPVNRVTYEATIAKYRKLHEERLGQQEPEDVSIDNAKAQAELLELMEEMKPARLRANSLLGL